MILAEVVDSIRSEEEFVKRNKLDRYQSIASTFNGKYIRIILWEEDF